MKTFLNLSKTAFSILISLTLMTFAVSCKEEEDTDLDPNNALGTKYLDEVYEMSALVQTTNIVYGSEASVQQADIFEVPENEDLKRPLVLLSVGGGFRTYNQLPEVRRIAEDLAKRGYVAGIVNYHINQFIDHSDSDMMQRIWLQGVVDQRTAIRYFKTNAEMYRIDPEKVFIGGWSNGGQLAITTATLQDDDLEVIENESLRSSVTSLVEELGMEGTDHMTVTSEVRGALLLNVYTFDRASIDSSDPALMFVHHEDSHISDGTRTIGVFTLGEDLYYGPRALTLHAESVGYKMGEDLEYIEMKGERSDHPNYAALSDTNFDDFAAFFYRNLE